ncbi:MAG: hypothetical protein J6Z04_00385 [Clostridia bacterium]|nr:hypothetical protein [Clostridia bacterium]
MKRLLCLCLVLCSILLLLPSCNDQAGPAGTSAPASTVDPNAPVYTVIFKIRGELYEVPTRENAIPVPPEGYDAPYSTVDKNFTFAGWDKELVAPTAEYMEKYKQMVYYARYDSETRYYDVTFRIGEETYPVSVAANELPVCPVTPESSGQVFTRWDKEPVPAKENAAYTAVFMDDDCPSTFTVATWNIGHFANGNAAESKIKDADYDTKSSSFRNYINGLGADLLCLNEYSRYFTDSQNHPASEALFEETPPVYYAGPQRNFSCNAVFSRLPLRNLTLHEFECNKNAVLLYSSSNKAHFYYYVTAELTVGTETVHFVFTHLAFDEARTPDTVCMAQINELIELYKDVDHVVMMGDWNAYHKNMFDPFADAGYTLGNYGETLTCIGSKTGGLEWAVDDIIVKGLTMTGFHAVNTGLSDHIAVVATLTLPQP